jgi:hypothetical protein
VPLHAIVGAEFLEGARRELPTTIGTQSSERAPALHLGAGLDARKGCLRFVLGGEQHQPHETAEIIHHQQEIPLAAGRWRCYGATQIRMDQLHALSSPEFGHLRERCSALLPRQTRITDLIGMINVRHAAHKLLP